MIPTTEHEKNKNIKEKLLENAQSDKEVQAFLMDLFDYETGGKNGYYTDFYEKTLRKYVK